MSINDIMKTVNKSSLFGQISPDHILTARTERQDAEKRIKERKREQEKEQRRFREEEERRKNEDEEFARREYEEYVAKYKRTGVLQSDNRILKNEPHVRNLVNLTGEGGMYSNRVQAEIWQPGPAPRYTEFEHRQNPEFTFRPAVERSPPESLGSRESYGAHSPSMSSDDFPDLPAPAPPAPTTPVVKKSPPAGAKPRRSRVAANFTRQFEEPPPVEPVVEPAAAPRYASWRDPPSAPSINDIRPDRRVIGQINSHLVAALNEFSLRKDDFPPIGGRSGKK